MIPLEVIGVLGILYCFFMYATVRTYLAKNNMSVREKLRESRLVAAITNVVAAVAISVLGILYCFFVYVTGTAYLARNNTSALEKVRERAASSPQSPAS